MLTFLRRMRHQLLAQNRLTRYLVYALGEIVLVVAGILIALMINSAWQDRQERIYEKEVLQQLRTSLREDMLFFELVSERVDRRAAAVRTLIAASQSGQTEVDTALMNRYWDVINLGFSFDYNTSIYESLKIRGVEKIRNDSVRLQILKTFENTLPRLTRFINTYDENMGIDSRVLDLQVALFTSEPAIDPNGTPYIRMIPQKGFLQKNELTEILRLHTMELENFYSRKVRLVSQLELILDTIDRELERIEG